MTLSVHMLFLTASSERTREWSENILGIFATSDTTEERKG